jgi:hypothetical protein
MRGRIGALESIKRAVLIISMPVLLADPGAAPAQIGGMPGDAVEQLGQGAVNWTSGEVFATGIGAPPPNAVNPAQARAMAERAALVVALRNLLEIAKGVRVDSDTEVEDFLVKSDSIRTRVDGVVRGAMPVKKRYLSDGSVEITVVMKMRGDFLDAVVPEHFGGAGSISVSPQPFQGILPKPPAAMRPQPALPSAVPEQRPASPTPEPSKPAPSSPPPPAKLQPVPARDAPALPTDDRPSVQFRGGTATGIVIDGRGLGLRPALLPKIVDPQGKEIYVGQVVTRTNAVEQGVAGYARDLSAASGNFRVTDNPAVFKALRSSGTARTDIVLAQADAEKLRELSRSADFLQYCRVIIVY